MEIVTDYAELSKRSDELDIRKEGQLIRETIIKLKDTIRDKNLKSLSAPQIGINRRVFVLNFSGDLRSFCNPIITKCEGFTISRETCPSVPEKTFIVPRYTSISVTFQTPLGKVESCKLAGLAAYVFQHELDHLEGIIISDIGMEIDKSFDDATEKERAQIIKMYLDSIDIKSKDMQQEIKDDAELGKLNSSIDFMEKLQKGEIKVSGSVTVDKTTKEVEIDE